MRVNHLLTLLSCLTLMAACCQPLYAEVPKDEKNQPAEKAKAQEEAKDNADKDKQPAADKKQKPAAEQPRRSRVPKHQAMPNPNTARNPSGLPTGQELYFPEGAARRNAVPQPSKPQQRPNAPANAQPDQALANPQFGAPNQTGLSPSAAYRLGSMGTHVQLNPSVRWYLNRSQQGAYAQPNNQASAATTAPGEGAATFYPGVSRLPTQKPFADLERQPSGLQSYWPLLLEGRQDSNTGLIIWSLP